MKKRVLSIALVLCMVCSLLPTMALATTTADRYEAIAIANESLNGNIIWGLTEARDGILLDDWAGLYTQDPTRNGGSGGLPSDGKLTTDNGVPYQLASGEIPAQAYDSNDAIRLTGSYTSQTMDLQTIGAYETIYVLATAGGPGTGRYADFKVTLTYTDGTTSETTYKLYDWYDRTPVDGVEQYDNIWRINKTGEYELDSSEAPILHSATIEADPGRLLRSIGFTMLGGGSSSEDPDAPVPTINELFCGIFAVTGAISANAPGRPTAEKATDVNSGDDSPGFTANWTAADDKATSFRLDVSERENFTTLVDGYNNKDVGNVTTYVVEGLKPNTTYYYRVRAVNNSGQSLSSKRIATDLPAWIKAAGLTGANAEYDLETGLLQLTAGATLTAPLVLPDGSSIALDLNRKTLSPPPAGQPAIKAPAGGKVALTLLDSAAASGAGVPLTGGAGKPAIDFSEAAPGSRVTLSEKVGVQGGISRGNMPGGDGILGNSDTTIVVSQNSTATGGQGGEHGGNGGNGVTGGNVTLNGDATGGKGGKGVPAGTGGIGANAANISGSGNATGGNGGDGPAPGTGGKGAPAGASTGSVHVSDGNPGAQITEVTISGLTAPAAKNYDGTPYDKALFGNPTAVGYDEPLSYTYYQAAADTGTELGELLLAAPSDAGSYILVVSTPADDTANVGQAAVRFTINKCPCTTTVAAPSGTPAASTATGLTLAPVTAPSGDSVEYGYSTAMDTQPASWQDSTTFDTLSPKIEYVFFARVKENANHLAGPASDGTKLPSVLAVAIAAANAAKNGIVVNDKPASAVPSGTKFVTEAEMRDLTDALDAAQTVADDDTATDAAAIAVITNLDNALTTFRAAIKTGTYSDGGGGSSSDGGTAAPPATGTIVDGKPVDLGKTETKGDTTTVILDSGKLDKSVAAAKDGSKVTIPVATTKGSAAAQLTAESLEKLADKNMTLEITSGKTSYTLPAAAVDRNSVLNQLGATDASKVAFTVTITNEKNAKVEGATLVVPPVSFTVTATYNGKSVTVDSFNSMVARTLELTREQADKVTTAVVIENGKIIRHVPTYVYEQGGKYYAKINSMTNSTYAIIVNENAFTDTTGKWYEDAANELSAREITKDIWTTSFDGDKAMTRAEMAALIVNALGLPKTVDAPFRDVSADAWYSKFVAAANEYGIITGYSDGSFQPNATITRQQAMVMIARAAKVAAYAGGSAAIDSFPDYGQVGAWAKAGVDFSLKSGLIAGRRNGTLDLDGSITRGQTATVLLRLLQNAELVDVRAKV